MKISFSLRAFVGYFIILAGLSWFIIDNAIERINLGLRQSAESVLVDTANIIASVVEGSLVLDPDQPIDPQQLADIIDRSYQRDINAMI